MGTHRADDPADAALGSGADPVRARLVALADIALTAPQFRVYRETVAPGQCRWIDCGEQITDVDPEGPWCWRHRAWHHARLRIVLACALARNTEREHLSDLGFWP